MKKLLMPLLMLLAGLSATAQKLPNVQPETGLRAPANVLVDGKATEWSNKFQAYNHATEIFYTMANDDDNLYLVIQTGDPGIISRIMGRGITLSIQNERQKSDKHRMSITYPVTRNTVYLGLQNKKAVDEDTSVKALDLLMKRYNKKIDDSCKLIRVSGIPGVDTLVSVYNSDGINARAQFNNKKVFTCEFSIDLKLLNVLANNIVKFSYHIIVNGNKPMEIPSGFAVLVNGRPDEKASAQFITDISALVSKRSAITDFWGEYTLAKK